MNTFRQAAIDLGKLAVAKASEFLDSLADSPEPNTTNEQPRPDPIPFSVEGVSGWLRPATEDDLSAYRMFRSLIPGNTPANDVCCFVWIAHRFIVNPDGSQRFAETTDAANAFDLDTLGRVGAEIMAKL